MAKKGLTVKQQRFVDCWDGDIKEAAKKGKLGYAYCRQLMMRDEIKSLIRGRERTKANIRIATREDRQAFWTKTMEGKLSKRLSHGDKLRASELLGKSEMDFTEKHIVEGTIELKCVDYSSLGKTDE